jgi:hypothetical protein
VNSRGSSWKASRRCLMGSTSRAPCAIVTRRRRAWALECERLPNKRTGWPRGSTTPSGTSLRTRTMWRTMAPVVGSPSSWPHPPTHTHRRAARKLRPSERRQHRRPPLPSWAVTHLCTRDRGRPVVRRHCPIGPVRRNRAVPADRCPEKP